MQPRKQLYQSLSTNTQDSRLVMPGLVPGIHVFLSLRSKEDVDGRDKPGHDVVRSSIPNKR
jgi:hypothetical protein